MTFDTMRRVNVKIKLPRLGSKMPVESNPKIKILWSQKMEDQEAERAKAEAERMAKQKEHLRLSAVLKSSKQVEFQDMFNPTPLLATSKDKLKKTLGQMF